MPNTWGSMRGLACCRSLPQRLHEHGQGWLSYKYAVLWGPGAQHKLTVASAAASSSGMATGRLRATAAAPPTSRKGSRGRHSRPASPQTRGLLLNVASAWSRNASTCVLMVQSLGAATARLRACKTAHPARESHLRVTGKSRELLSVLVGSIADRCNQSLQAVSKHSSPAAGDACALIANSVHTSIGTAARHLQGAEGDKNSVIAATCGCPTDGQAQDRKFSRWRS